MPAADRAPRPTLFLPAAALLLAAAVGCGSSGPPRGAVRGTVTFEGKPVESGAIVFLPAEGLTGPSAGGPIVNGSYAITRKDGPLVGKHRVEIRASRTEGTRTVKGPTDSTGPTAGGSVEKVVMYIPAKYNQNSKLTAEIKPGDNDVPFELMK